MSDMYSYNNNSERNEKYGAEDFYDYETPNENGQKRNNRKPNAKMVKFAKRVGAIALSAVLFGGVAAGTFQGVGSLIGTSAKSETQAAASTKSSLLKTTSSTTSKGTMEVTDIVKSAMPSIVSITSKSVQEVENYFGMFGGRNSIQQQEVESAGSGIIIGKNDSELLIATNNHVIDGAETVSVSFVDNETYEATIKGTDSSKDLAVVAVPLSSISSDTMSKISVAAIGDSSKLEVGEQVVAIGNALGYGQSVTTGIVSATNRTLDSTDSSEASYDGISLIQTDAAINPGNSGGALLNMNGEVVGINSAKLASTEVEGMGYAISMNDAYDTIEELMNETTRTKVTDDEKASLGISGTGALYKDVKHYFFPIGIILVLLTLFIVQNLVNSRSGRAIMATRDNRIAAESVGIDVTKFKLLAFTISAALAGVAGVLYAHNLSMLKVSGFDYNMSILILVYVVLGGIGNLRGSMIATIILYALPELLRGFANYRMLIYAIVLIVMMLFNWAPAARNWRARTMEKIRGTKNKKEAA